MASKAKTSRATPNIKAACEECRSRKTKCDGARPACLRCINRSKNCVYDAEPDEYRATALRRKCKMWEGQALAGEQMLLALRDLPEDESVDILRRLRQKENVEDILESLSNYGSQSNDRRGRAASDAASQGSAGSVATSSVSFQEGSSQPPQSQQVSQKVQFAATEGQPEREDRSKVHDRLAIDFLVNNAGDDPQSSNQQQTRTQIGKAAPHSPHDYNRMHSYPPLALSAPSVRRLSAPMSMVIDSQSSAAQASDGTRLAAADEAGASGQNMEWDNYFTTVSRLMKKMGQEPTRRQQ